MDSLLADIIFDGKFDIDAIQEDYKKFTSSKDTRTTTQKMLQGWGGEMDDETFKNSLSEIKEDFAQDKFLKSL